MIITGSCMIENPTNEDILETIQTNINTIKRNSTFCTYFFADDSTTHLSISFGYKDLQNNYHNLSIVFSLINMSPDDFEHFKINQKMIEFERLCDV